MRSELSELLTIQSLESILQKRSFPCVSRPPQVHMYQWGVTKCLTWKRNQFVRYCVEGHFVAELCVRFFKVVIFG